MTLRELAGENHDRLAVVFGTEGHGLTPATISASDRVVRIPMSHGVDSLNVAAAAAVTLYSLTNTP
jgi:tRNA G18 (ribose-2'-O)-methylase SpoU